MPKVAIYRSEPEIKEAKTLAVCAKCRDLFGGTLYDEYRNTVYEYDGYVPCNLGIGGGDYIEFEIDLETGQILNWKKPKEITIEE